MLLKETIDNSVDEFTMGCGKKIEIELAERTVRVRDYGRGIPLGKLLDCVSIINTGAKYDSETFKKAVGLNGVGQKAVNALSLAYRAQAVRDGQTKVVEFAQGQAEEGPQGRQDRRAQRHDHRVHARRGALRQRLQVPHRVHRGHALELRLPQPRPHAHAQRQAVQIRERPRGPARRRTSAASRSIRSSTSRARTSRSPSPTAATTARSTSRSSTASTRRWAAPISRPSARRSSRRCAISTRRTSTPPTSASRSSPRSPCA